MIKIKAIEISHGAKDKKHQLFVGAVKIKDIVDGTKIKVDYWRLEDRGKPDQGYQRIETPSQVKKIKKMVLLEGTNFPTTLLLSYRKLSARMPSYNYDKKLNELQLDEYPIYLVDGQHRAAGIREALNEYTKKDPSLLEKEVGVVVMVGLDKFEEAQYFEIINTTSRPVKTNLANELLVDRAKKFPGLMDGLKNNNQTWMVKGNGIVHKLNELSGSPWYEVVKMPNKKYDKDSKAVAGSGQFLQSLKLPLEQNLRLYKLDESAKIINDYWEVLRDLFPDAFIRPKNYVIQKTTGMFSLHMLLNYIMLKLSFEKKDFSKENFKKYLRQIFKNMNIEGFEEKNDNSRFWQSGNHEGASVYRGQAGFKSLYTRFIDEGTDEDIV